MESEYPGESSGAASPHENVEENSKNGKEKQVEETHVVA
jgi:hypothetical protein